MNQNLTLKILNKLGPLYHSYFGLHPEEKSNEIEHFINIKNKHDKEILKEYNSDNKIKIISEKTNEEIGLTDIRVNNSYLIIFDYEELKPELLNSVPYDEIILKYSDDYWTRVPREWYNEPSKWWTNYIPYLKDYVLPFLESRDYIIVEKPFYKIKISKEKKGSALTIDDILFATRGLMADDTRTVNNGYKIIEEIPNKILKLEPMLDNWST